MGSGRRPDHIYRFTVHEASERPRLLLEILDLQIVPVGEREITLAVDANTRFGKGRHPAKLNMGDCYDYAYAKANQARLLFKGDQFVKADVEAAYRPV